MRTIEECALCIQLEASKRQQNIQIFHVRMTVFVSFQIFYANHKVTMQIKCLEWFSATFKCEHLVCRIGAYKLTTTFTENDN